MPLLFAATLFLSAALLFWVQPLVAKSLLPALGGTPAVWNTCMLFFQAALLAGYAYALALTRRLGFSAQAAAHLALLAAAAAAALSLRAGGAADASAPPAGDPAWWLLGTLLGTLGLPFFALSATAPLLQQWLSRTRHTSARDPYFLYAASNAGSLAALVCFPALLEPRLALAAQARLWGALYVGLALLVAACALAAHRSGATRSHEAADSTAEAGGEGVGALRRLRWAFLAFVPSSLVLGVTSYVTTDVASVPLLWVVPLALYLLTFVLAFARREVLPGPFFVERLLPGAAVVLTLVYLSGATEPAWFLVVIHLAFLFVAAYACHRLLADDRPPARRLAEFYLLVAAGGAAGALFNALVAPLVFDAVVEYPLAVVLACLARVRFGAAREDGAAGGLEGAGGGAGAKVARRARLLDVALPCAVALAVAGLSAFVMRTEMRGVERLALAIGLPLLVVNHLFTRRPLRFALALSGVMLGSLFFREAGARVLRSERNFYGVLKVVRDPSNLTLKLHHGSTIHGRQFEDASLRCEPLSYYHRRGPLGSLFKAFAARGEAAARVAAVGLGAGSVVAYSRPGEEWTFYEINPAVLSLAREEGYFTYLTACAGAPVRVVLGDARLRMREAPDAQYQLVLLDAFSSDAVPAHLLTREALDLYLQKLAPGGWLAFHVSNRSLDLHAVVAGLAADARLAALVFDDDTYDRESAREPSHWVVVARAGEDLSALAADPRWGRLTAPRPALWRDDFSDVLSVFKWRGVGAWARACCGGCGGRVWRRGPGRATGARGTVRGPRGGRRPPRGGGRGGSRRAPSRA